jgi:triphosphoribosyl-dephospho-CoA synthase
LFALMAELDDTNLLWRGGREGLAYGHRSAADFLAAGGVFATDWREHAEAIDRDFVAHRLSPGGSADLLGVTLFLAELDGLA